jgi:hypothetical protein
MLYASQGRRSGDLSLWRRRRRRRRRRGFICI